MWTTLGRGLAARLRQTLRVWVAVCPTAFVARSTFGDALAGLPPPLQIVCSTLLVVPVVTNFSLPLVQRCEAWLSRRFAPG